MDLQTIQSTVLRNGGYVLEGGYLSVVPKSVLFSRAVNMASIGDQLTAITYDDPYSGVGSYTDVPDDAEIVVYDQNTDTVKGRLRVAYGGASSTVIQVNEVSKGDLEVADNDRFEVWDEYRLRAKLVAASDTFDKDSRRAYVDEGVDPAPNVVCGGAVVGWVDSSGILTAIIDCDDSHPMDLASSSVSFVLDPADGTITSNGGDDTISPFTVESDVANGVFRHMTLTVTDDDNSKTTTRKIPVWTHDADHPPIRVFKASYNYDRSRGDWAAQFTLDGDDAAIDLLRDGAYCVYWEVESYNGTEASYGNPFTGRSNIKFAGYLRRDTVTIDPNNDTLTIEAVSPLQKLAELPGFSQVLDYAGVPANWQQDIAPTLNKLVWYVWNYHTNASLYFDWVKMDTDYVFPNFTVQQDTLTAQMREVVQGVSCLVSCDQTGRFLTRRNLQRGTTTERGNAETVLALTSADLTAVTNWATEHAYQYNSVLLKMFTTSGDPMLSIAPGEAPAEAPDRTTYERAIGLDQTEANWISAWYWQELNSLYEGKPVEKGFACKPHPGYGVVDPAYDQWVTLTLPSTTNRRGRSLSGERFIMRRVTVETDPVNGLKDITWVMDRETYTSNPGITRVVPEEATLPPYNPTPYVPTPLPLPNSISRIPAYVSDQLPTKLFICDSGAASAHVATSWSPTVSSLTYTDISTGLTGNCVWACSDPYDYRRRFMTTTTGLYRCDNIWAASPSWSLVANNATLFGDAARIGHYIVMSINRKGWIMVLSGVSGRSVSFDYGATWASGSVHNTTASYGTTARDKTYCDVAVSCFNNGAEGWMYSVSGSPYTFSGTAKLCKSVDWGLNWSVITSGAAVGAVNVNANLNNTPRIAVGYKRSDGTTNNINDSSQELVIVAGEGNYGNTRFNAAAGTGAWTAKADYNSSNAVRPTASPSQRPFMPFTYDLAKIMMLYDRTSGDVYLHPTDDLGATGTDHAFEIHTFNQYSYFNVNGFPVHRDAALMWSTEQTTINWTDDDGTTIHTGIAAPGGYSGVAYCEWDISHLVAPA